MEREFIPYEQALALKELGFDNKCLGAFLNTDFVEFFYTKKPTKYSKLFTKKSPHCVAPTFSQAFRWFREKYNLYHVITIADLGKYETGNPDFQSAIYSKDPVVITIMNNYKTYEEAELECLKKLIEIVKEKQL